MKISVLFGILAVVMIGAVIFTSSRLNIQAARKQAENDFSAIADQAAGRINLWLTQKIIQVRTTANGERVVNYLTTRSEADKALAERYLKNQYDTYGEFENVFIGDYESGTLLVDGIGGTSVGQDLTTFAFLGESQENGVYVEPNLFTSPTTGKLVFTIAAAVDNASGKRIGFVVYAIDWSKYIAENVVSTKIGKTGNLIIFDGKYTVIAHNNKDLMMTVQKDTATMAAVDGKNGFQRYERGGLWKYMAYRPITHTGWTMAAVMNEDELIAGTLTSLRISIAIAAGILPLGIVLTLIVLRGFTVPLRKLSEASDRIAKGDLEVAVAVKSRDELGDLAG